MEQSPDSEPFPGYRSGRSTGWTQPPLLAMPYPLVTAELSVHLDGMAGQVDWGYRIRATDYDETIAMGTLWRSAIRTVEVDGRSHLDALIEQALSHTRTF